MKKIIWLLVFLMGSFYANSLRAIELCGDATSVLKQHSDTIIRICSEEKHGKYVAGNKGFREKTKGIVTMNSPSRKKGILKEIYINSSGKKTFRLAIGLIDQRGWAIPRVEFDVETVSGDNYIDMLSKGIQMEAGEYLFVYYNYYSDEQLRWKPYSKKENNHIQMLYSDDVAGTLKKMDTKFGAFASLGFSIVEVESAFALKGDLEKVKQTMRDYKQVADNALNLSATVKDRLGNSYRMVVVDGVITPIPMVYKKVLVLCNSIGKHRPFENLGWYADRGMAATITDNDFVHQLETILRTKEPAASVTPVTMATWERNFSTNKSELLDTYLTNDVDCIIYRIGENVIDTDNYEKAFKELVEYCMDKCPSSEQYIAGMVWPSNPKETAMINVASELGLVFVNVQANGPKYIQKMGFYYQGDDGKLYPIVNKGVAAHTNDHGMYVIADQLAKAMHYENPITLYDINVVSEMEYISFDKGIANGIISIKTEGIPSVSDSLGNQVSVTYQSDGVYTFVMPKSNVNVNIKSK